MEELVAGDPAPPVRRVHRGCQIRLQTIVDNFENCEHVDYVKRIAHNIKL